MERYYSIEWYPTKERNPIHRTTLIQLSKPTGHTEFDAQNALKIFIANLGGLKKNTIVKIIEMDENGPIGEPITPVEGENAIIPIKKR